MRSLIFQGLDGLEYFSVNRTKLEESSLAVERFESVELV